MAVKASTTSSNPFAQSVTELLGASLGRAPSGVRDTQSAQDHPSPWGHVPGLVPQPQHPLFLGYLFWDQAIPVGFPGSTSHLCGTNHGLHQKHSWNGE